MLIKNSKGEGGGGGRGGGGEKRKKRERMYGYMCVRASVYFLMSILFLKSSKFLFMRKKSAKS